MVGAPKRLSVAPAVTRIGVQSLKLLDSTRPSSMSVTGMLDSRAVFQRVGKGWRRGEGDREVLNFPGDGRWSSILSIRRAARCFGKLISPSRNFHRLQFIRASSARSIWDWRGNFENGRRSSRRYDRRMNCSFCYVRIRILVGGRKYLRSRLYETIETPSLEKSFDRVQSTRPIPLETLKMVEDHPPPLNSRRVNSPTSTSSFNFAFRVLFSLFEIRRTSFYVYCSSWRTRIQFLVSK